jgi:hypothetical protein
MHPRADAILYGAAMAAVLLRSGQRVSVLQLRRKNVAAIQGER